MGAFPITEAHLSAVFAESIAYGIYCVSLGFCIHALLTSPIGRKRPDGLNWWVVVVALTMGAIATIDVSIEFYHVSLAFVYSKLSPAEQFSIISDWVNVIQTITVQTQTLIGDAILIYRCWVLYNHNSAVVLLALCLWVGGFACTILALYHQVKIQSFALLTSDTLRPFVTAFWALTIALNISTTGLLVWRIWSADRDAKMFQQSNPMETSNLQLVIRSIIESGLLYTTIATATALTYIMRTSAPYVLANLEVQAIGIAFNLIIIRAARRAALEENEITRNTGRDRRDRRSRLHSILEEDPFAAGGDEAQVIPARTDFGRGRSREAYSLEDLKRGNRV